MGNDLSVADVRALGGVWGEKSSAVAEACVTLAGLEPAIFGSEGQRLIHQATGPLENRRPEVGYLQTSRGTRSLIV